MDHEPVSPPPPATAGDRHAPALGPIDVPLPPGRARTWAVLGALGAVTAPWLVLPGVVGMVAGSVSHLKGDRWGMPVAVTSAVTTIVGMALVFWTGS